MCLVIGFNGFYCIFRWIHQWKPNIKLSTLIPSFHVSFAIFFFILWPISDLRYAEDSVETTETVLVVVLVLLTFIPLATYSYNFRDTIVIFPSTRLSSQSMTLLKILIPQSNRATSICTWLRQ